MHAFIEQHWKVTRKKEVNFVNDIYRKKMHFCGKWVKNSHYECHSDNIFHSKNFRVCFVNE